jgi:hypothetical protein
MQRQNKGRVAMILCLILALGWISDMGLLSLKIGENQIVGIPTQNGYVYTITYDKWVTKFIPAHPMMQWKLWGLDAVGVIVNGEFVHATRLGNGWLFQFKEQYAAGQTR